MQLMFTPDVYELVLENNGSELNPTLSLSTITDVLSVTATVRGLDVNRLAEQLLLATIAGLLTCSAWLWMTDT